MKPYEKIKEAQRLLRDAHKDLVDILKSERSRKRGEALRQVHTISNMLSHSPLFFSQSGQDRVVDRILNGKRNGIFVDIGGYDGVTGSNTLFFEVFRNWTGILVEPSQTRLQMAKAVRKCPCLGYAVAEGAGRADFMEVTSGYTQMSGLLISYTDDMLQQVRANPQHKEVIHTLEKQTLDTVLSEHNLEKIDFLSLDVEGGEMNILSSFPFDKYDIDIFSVENNSQTTDLPQLMQSKGYELVEFVGVDDIYRKTNGQRG